MNKVILTGRLTRDIENRTAQSGKIVGRTSIAVDRRGKKDEADFFNLVAFDKTAEFIQKWLGKGSRIVVEGRLSSSSYEDKDGNKRYSVEVIADNVEFADSKKSDGTKNSTNKNSAPADDVFGGEPVDDEDTPF